ncbi:MAG: hypothetical protein Q9221_006748 [Calogaya cf. arnoldii]
MRLLNTISLNFSEFFDSNIPKYAILSHRWGAREIGFKEILKRTAPPGPALRKIERCCKLAASRGLQWVWIDTCCIDKRSSAELSEAINSMYKWYERSEVCYVYLNDVHYTPTEPWDFYQRDWKESEVSKGIVFKEEFESSLWFTRGWTLQELLAPEAPVFFDAEWREIGTRLDLNRLITTITGIPEKYLVRGRVSSQASTAAKMSFAASRTTSREEDIAYCLLGLFDVTMPLLYGEGASSAFQRLQIEIIRKSSDESLFAWTSNEPASGMLAPHSSCFADSSGVRTINSFSKGVFNRRSYPQHYKDYDIHNLKPEMKTARTIYVKQPDAIEVEYSRILSQIEAGELQFAKLSFVATHDLSEGVTFMNPGPTPIATDSGGRFIELGDGSPEAQADARWHTYNALMTTAADVVFSGEPRDRILCQDREWGDPKLYTLKMS